MPKPPRALPSVLLSAFGLILLVAAPLAAQKKTARQLRAEEFLAKLPEKLARQFQTVVMPTLLQAESNDRVFDQAEKLYTAWIRELELNGIKVDPSSLELAMVARGKAYRTAILGRGRHCFERKDPSEVVVMQGLWRTAESQGLQTDLTAEALEELLSKCVRFELVFTSDILQKSEGGTQRTAVKATVPLVLDAKPDTGTIALLRGTGPIDYVSFELHMRHLPRKCRIVTSTQSAQATVHRLKYKMERASAKAPARFSEVELWLHPGEPTETLTMCDIKSTDTRWFTLFKILHLSEQSAPPDKAFFIFKDWKVLGAGKVFATKEVTEPSKASPAYKPLRQTFSGTMRLELHHKPVRP
jgi:hypothetical protein